MPESHEPDLPWSEQDRIAAIKSYEILDTPREQEFEDIVKMAARACDMPISLITFVETGRQWFKAGIGTDLRETPLNVSICSQAILQRELFVVPDTTQDDRFKDNPLVAGDPHLRFYAGAPLETAEGLPLGTVCVLDYKPRTLTEEQAETLKSLARQVMTQLELRRTLTELRRSAKARTDSEIRLNLALDASEFIGTWQWDIVNDRMFADPRFVSAFGGEPHWTTEGASLKEYLKAIHVDDLPRVKASIEKTLKSRVPYKEENRLVQKDGSVRWIEARGKCIFDDRGKPLQFPGVAVDVTERKIIEQKLRDAADRFQFMAEAMPQKLWTAAPTGELTFFNNQWMEYTGLTFEQIRDWGWKQFIHPEDLNDTVSIYTKAVAEGKPFEMEQRFRRHDGVYRWHLARGAPMRNASGEVIMWMGSNTDVDDHRRESQLLGETAAKFRSLFDQSSSFAGILTLDGTLIEANSFSLEGCGFKEADTLNRPFWQGGWWQNSPDVQQKIQKGIRFAALGTPYLETFPYHTADGTARILEFALHPIRDEKGKIILLHPTGIDVTERHQAEARAEFLVRLTQKLSTVADPTEINRAATREIGQFLGVDRCYFFHPLPELDKIRVLPDWHHEAEFSLEGDYALSEFGPPEWAQAFQTHSVSVDDVRTHAWTKDFQANYTAIDILAYMQTPFVHEGKWVACISVNSMTPRHWNKDERDLLENAAARVWPLIARARVEEALRSAQSALGDANALLESKAAQLESIVQQRTQKLSETIGELEAFSYSISHDMRAPLRSMIGFSEALKEDYGKSLDAQGVAYLSRIINASRRMDRLIQDVLNFSKLSRQDVLLESVDIDALTREIVHSYPNLHSEIVDISIKPTLPSVKGNEALLTQCFSNLLENGAKFVEKDRKARIEVWGESSVGRVKIYFKDNGIGMSEHSLERIFDIFQRVGRDEEGTGIGLAIVRKAAEKMGGSVKVKSELGKGSLFWLDLESA